MAVFSDIKKWFDKLFSHNEREIKKLYGEIVAINDLEPEISALTDEQLKGKTAEFRARLKEGETIDDLLPEAFAVVRETSKRVLGMRHYDVQLIGGIILHRGIIAEMKTGEGKTLVATLPLYLNALSGKGAHLVTVNDYLARRDAEWMGKIYKFLGLEVGIIQHDMAGSEKKKAYGADITYGTNNEFGFDYLRDNLKVDIERCVQRGFNFAIVDEVDSILIDEARTPLIISGEVEKDTHSYLEFKGPVETLVKRQQKITGDLFDAAMALDDDPDRWREQYFMLCQVEKGEPKNKRLMKYVANNPEAKKLMQKIESDLSVAKEAWKLKEGLLYAYSERENSIELTDEGQDVLEKMIGDVFILPVIQDAEVEIDAREDIDDAEKAELKAAVYDEYAEKSEKLHNINQLLKGFTVFVKDVDYVVNDGEVVIVDEFTGRMMPGRRWSDGLHQAVEAKENVTVAKASQTVATVTLQNYFRMYDKLAGMTGTAVTEAAEFNNIYKLPVLAAPTNMPIRRADYEDVIYKTMDGKFRAVVEEVIAAHKDGQPCLVGTVSVDVSERISKMLTRKGVKHNVLNAKKHQREADIVAQAGRKGAVTIATNMAGRGTDILLGGNPEYMAGLQFEGVEEASAEEKHAAYEKAKAKCEAERQEVLEAGGFYIIGTERHESRRIDNQLRGRAGRQGDPGCSRFFLSLEDDLMRIFGSDRIAKIMERFGIEDEEAVIESRLVSRAIENAQKKVEENNFQSRKKLLEYDDVNNKQREIIYGIRQQILEGRRVRERVSETADILIEGIVDETIPEKIGFDEWDFSLIRTEFGRLGIFGLFGQEKFNRPNPAAKEKEISNLMVDVYRFRRDDILEKPLIETKVIDYLSLLDDPSPEEFAEILEIEEPGIEPVKAEIEGRVREMLGQLFDRQIEIFSSGVLSKSGMEQYLKLLVRAQYDRKAEEIFAFTNDPLYYEQRIVARTMLQVMDKNWMAHLDALDHVKDGVHLAGYGGRDPVVEYKREAFAIFSQMLEDNNREVLEKVLSLRVRRKAQSAAEKQKEMVAKYTEKKEEVDRKTLSAAQLAAAAASRPVGMRKLTENAGGGGEARTPVTRNEPKVGRNDPCPCGSGKKFKKCHGV